MEDEVMIHYEGYYYHNDNWMYLSESGGADKSHTIDAMYKHFSNHGVHEFIILLNKRGHCGPIMLSMTGLKLFKHEFFIVEKNEGYFAWKMRS